MINASEIDSALVGILKKGLPNNYTIEQAGYVNMDYEKCPWVGVYRGKLEYDIATLGRGTNSWKAGYTIRVLVQSVSIESGEASEKRLEEYIKEILDIITANRNLNDGEQNHVDALMGMGVEYSYDESESESVYFQMAEITLTTEVRTS